MGCNTLPMRLNRRGQGSARSSAVKFQREMPGLDEPPFDTELGGRNL